MRRLLGLAGVCLSLVGAVALFGAADLVPSDPKPSCTVPAADFNKWFADGKATANGAVVPANSVDFSPTSLCDFYKWSWQMFLWLNSPIAAGQVFNSDQFFEVSGYDGVNRHFNPNVNRGRRVLKFSLFHAQAKKGKAIRVNRLGKVETPEVGQANTNGVLISQSGSLVYYGIATNNVFAYFLTGVKTKKIMAKQFPSTQAELKQVTDFAAPKTFKDDIALVLEVKTSWVEASSVADATKYVTIQGEVPVFDKTDPKKWVPMGSKTVQLAMVGMHIVGTVKDHPEMIWATFEHVDNAPNDTFTYTNATNQASTVNFDSSAPSVFCKANAPRPAMGQNTPLAQVDGSNLGNIVSTGAANIGPSDTVRFNPWGQDSSSPNVDNNTQIIAVNNSVRGQLAKDDVRGNYFLVGTTWTNKKIPGPGVDFKTVGSQFLANATMETYAPQSNCFSCHSGDPLGKGGGPIGADGLSHIYGDLAPLP
jgi:hypothetical protein